MAGEQDAQPLARTTLRVFHLGAAGRQQAIEHRAQLFIVHQSEPPRHYTPAFSFHGDSRPCVRLSWPCSRLPAAPLSPRPVLPHRTLPPRAPLSPSKPSAPALHAMSSPSPPHAR